MAGSVEEEPAGPHQKGDGGHSQGDGCNCDIVSLGGRDWAGHGDVEVEVRNQWCGGRGHRGNQEAAEGYVHAVSVLGQRLERRGKGGRNHPVVGMQRAAHGNADRDQSWGCHEVGGVPLWAHEGQVCGIGKESNEAAGGCVGKVRPDRWGNLAGGQQLPCEEQGGQAGGGQVCP